MGHGYLDFGTASLLNCRESYLRNIGAIMETQASGPTFELLRPLVSAWQHELETMPPGCFGLHLGHYLTTREHTAAFLQLLTEVVENLKHDSEKPGTLEEACRIRAFVSTQIAEPTAPPNGGPETPPGNSGVSEGPRSVS